MLFLLYSPADTYCHYDFPIYKHDELHNTNPDVDSLIDDNKVSIAVRDAQLTYLTFLPHLTGRTEGGYQRLLLEGAKTIEMQHVIDCLFVEGAMNKRVPQNFNYEKVSTHVQVYIFSILIQLATVNIKLIL